MDKLATEARELGKQAFLAGMGQAPILNNKLDDLTKELKEVGSAIPIYKAYLDGWHSECDKSLFSYYKSV